MVWNRYDVESVRIIIMLEELEKLREHLHSLYLIFDQFCKNVGFSYVEPTSIGRYPRIRVVKISSNLEQWLDLWNGAI